MKNNSHLIKANYKTQFGIDLSDEQLENMMGAMNPGMFKQAKQMMDNDPQGFEK